MQPTRVTGLRVLLVGGSGFLSGHAARALVRAGHQVAALTRGTRPLPRGVEHLPANRGDTAQCSTVLRGRRFDLTVDFAAFDASDIEALVLGSEATLGAYVLISTGQVYLVTLAARAAMIGPAGAARDADVPAPFSEESNAGPLMAEPDPGTSDHSNWVYGIGKRRAESALLALAPRRGVLPLILRLPIVMGEEDGSLRLWAYLERLLDGGPIVLPDGGRMRRRFLWVTDLASTLVRFAGEGLPSGTTYNLAQPEVTTLREVLDVAARACGRPLQVAEAPWEECDAAGLTRDFSPLASPWASILDPARASADWGFEGTAMPDYLPAVVRWHLEHRPTSHAGYAERAREIELAMRLGVGR